jgi:hypothetical protein
MRLATALVLASAVAALAGCGDAVTSQDAQDVYETDAYGDYEKYTVAPARETELAFLSQVVPAGSFEVEGGATYRVFELYEQDRLEIAVALHGDEDHVWNLGDAFDVGIDEIEEVERIEGGLSLRVYEAGGAWAIYTVETDGARGALTVERAEYAEYDDAEPRARETLEIESSAIRRYAALPSLERVSMIRFESEAPDGYAHVFELDEDEGTRIVVGLRVGYDDPERIYDTKAVVKSFDVGYEIEPGYVDLAVEPVCPPPGEGCGIPFYGLAVDFDLTPDGKRLANEKVLIRLKAGVG